MSHEANDKINKMIEGLNLEYMMLGYKYALHKLTTSIDIVDLIPGRDLFSYDFTSEIENRIREQIEKLSKVELEDMEHLLAA